MLRRSARISFGLLAVLSATSAEHVAAGDPPSRRAPVVRGIHWKLFSRSSAKPTVARSAPPPAAPPSTPPSDVAVAASPSETATIVPAAALQQVPPAPDVESEAEPAPTVSVEANNAISLPALIALADAHHPRLMTAYQQVQAARGRAWQAGLYPNPVLATASPQLAGKESQYNAFISQDLVTAGKLKLDVAAVCREVQQAEFEWQAARFAIITDLRTQFYTTLAAQKRTATWETLVQIATRSHQVAEKLQQAGEGTRSDSLLVAIEVDRSQVGLANTETTYTIGRRQLAILTGMPELEFARLEGDLESPLPDFDEATLRYDVARANPAANIARVEIDRLGLKLERANVEPIPNINVMGGYQRQVAGDYQNMGLFQVSVVVPLWNRNQGNRFAVQSQLAGARADVHRIELDLANQAVQSLASYRTASQLVEKYETQILPKARETFRISEQLYSQGQIDFLRLLQAQKTLLEAELARIDALEQRWRAAAMIAGLRQDEHFP